MQPWAMAPSKHSSSPGIRLYCEIGPTRIYHGDCREAVDQFEGTVISDPPYGINYVHRCFRTTKFAGMRIIGDDKPFDPRPWLRYRQVLLWGAGHYASRLPEGGRWLVWDKRSGNVNAMSCVEIAWAKGTGGRADRIFHHLWDGFRKASEKGVPRVHPTQKPIALMEWCIGFYKRPGLIIDPYMGSGTTLVAATRLGLASVGIDIDERNCEIAAKRLQAG